MQSRKFFQKLERERDVRLGKRDKVKEVRKKEREIKRDIERIQRKTEA
jgi:hypothetical protein